MPGVTVIWYPGYQNTSDMVERDRPIRGYGTRICESKCVFVSWLAYNYEATTMAGSSCEDISISSGHDHVAALGVIMTSSLVTLGAT